MYVHTCRCTAASLRPRTETNNIVTSSTSIIVIIIMPVKAGGEWATAEQQTPAGTERGNHLQRKQSPGRCDRAWFCRKRRTVAVGMGPWRLLAHAACAVGSGEALWLPSTVTVTDEGQGLLAGAGVGDPGLHLLPLAMCPTRAVPPWVSPLRSCPGKVGPC